MINKLNSIPNELLYVGYSNGLYHLLFQHKNTTIDYITDLIINTIKGLGIYYEGFIPENEASITRIYRNISHSKVYFRLSYSINDIGKIKFRGYSHASRLKDYLVSTYQWISPHRTLKDLNYDK